MDTSAQEVANYFIELASKIDENDLTNLKLQKLLYFAQGKFLAKNEKKLFEEPIIAWALGPVVRSVYNAFRYCGSFPITAFDRSVKKTTLSSELKEFLSGVWDEYAKYSATYLVDLTHEKGSPWSDTYSRDANKEIPADLMMRYFKSRQN